jgi:hypothetical protein
MKARAITTTRDRYASDLERKYAAHLTAMRASNQIHGWRHETIKLRLADKTWYTPDFEVVANDGTITFIEVKGAKWMDDARVKVKVAAEVHPWYRFAAVTWNRLDNCWDREEFE